MKPQLKFGMTLASLVIGTALVGGCHHDHDDDHHRDHDERVEANTPWRQETIMMHDDQGREHRGYYDRDHSWHGGYYDDRHNYHDDPGDWRGRDDDHDHH